MLTTKAIKKLGKLACAGVVVMVLYACGGNDAEKPNLPPVPVDYSKRRALVIGVDGMQYEKLQEAIASGQAPNIAKFTIAKTYIGGIVGTVTEQATYSGPGWSTILTGAWVNRHQVTANDSKLHNQTDSVFKLIKEAAPTRRTASIISWDTINDNFARDIDLGYIDRAEKCHDIDQCVADKVSGALRFEDYSFVFAHFDEPDNAGHASGFGDIYQAAIHGVDAQVGQVLTALEQRKAQHPDEDWLVIITPDHGRATPDGHNHGNQTLSEKTTFIGINKPANAQLTAPITDSDDMGFGGLYGNATQADIVPTVLAHLGIKPAVENYQIDGVSLIGDLGVRQLAAKVDNKARSVTLKWRNNGEKSAASGKPLTIYRDGKLLATLTDSVSEYIDSTLQDVPNVTADLNYTVVTNDVPQSYLVRVNFSTSVPLNPSLLSGLSTLFLMENNLLDRLSGIAIAPWVSGTTVTFSDDDFGGKALRTDSNISGYKLENNLMGNNQQFTIGFWFNSGGQQSDTPILVNKDYGSGTNAGIAIAQFGNNIRFNFGDGSKRADLSSLMYTASQWVYVALAVDKATGSAQAYVVDPLKGMQTATLNFSNLDASKLVGLGRLALNEDALGTYFSRGFGNKGVMAFNDVALWTRLLTKDEVMGLFSSGKSISSLNP